MMESDHFGQGLPNKGSNEEDKNNNPVDMMSLYETRIQLMEERHLKELQTLDFQSETKLLRQDIENHNRLMGLLKEKDEETKKRLHEQRLQLMENFEKSQSQKESKEEDNTNMLLQLQLELQEQVKHLTERHEEEKLTTEETVKCLKLRIAFQNIQKFQCCQMANAFSEWRRALEIEKAKDMYSDVNGISKGIMSEEKKGRQERQGQEQEGEQLSSQEVDFATALRSPLSLGNSNSSNKDTSSPHSRNGRRGSRILLDDKDVLIKSLEANLAEYNQHIEEYTEGKRIYEKEKRDMQQTILKLKRENTILSSHVLTMIKANVEKGKVDFFASKRESSKDQGGIIRAELARNNQNGKVKTKSKIKTSSIDQQSNSKTNQTEKMNMNSIDGGGTITHNKHHSPINFISEDDTDIDNNNNNKDDNNNDNAQENKEESEKTFFQVREENDNFEMQNPLQNHNMKGNLGKESDKSNSKKTNHFDFARTSNFEDTSMNDLRQDEEEETKGSGNDDTAETVSFGFEFNQNALTDDSPNNAFPVETDWNNSLSSPFSPSDSMSSTNSSFSNDSFAENSPISISSIDSEADSSNGETKPGATIKDEFSEGFDNEWSSFDNDFGTSNDGFSDPFKTTNDKNSQDTFPSSNKKDPFQVPSGDPFSSDSFTDFTTESNQVLKSNGIQPDANSFFDEDPFGA